LTAGGKPADAAGAFTVATRLGGGAWSTLAEVKGNDAVDRRVDFLPTAADTLRVTVTETKGGIARVWEIEAY
jgi:hypothetical protein